MNLAAALRKAQTETIVIEFDSQELAAQETHKLLSIIKFQEGTVNVELNYSGRRITLSPALN